jgi:polyferredoxin
MKNIVILIIGILAGWLGGAGSWIFISNPPPEHVVSILTVGAVALSLLVLSALITYATMEYYRRKIKD